MPTIRGRVYDADGNTVPNAQSMCWLKNGVPQKQFPTEADGDYSVVLAAGSYAVELNGVPARPSSYTVTTVPLQTKDFRCA